MRVFVALELPECFSDEVLEVSRQLKVSCKGRFMSQDTYHVTLAFLGDIGECQVRDAMNAIDSACEDAESVELRSDGLGMFGRSNDGTLWLGLEKTPELMGLAQRVRDELDKRDLAYDKKSFLPHITLARRVRVPEGELPQLVFPSPTSAGKVTLFRSTLSSEGASYKELYSVELG